VSQDYNEAVQEPSLCFGDPDLRAAEPVTNALGLPVPCSGGFADVYHLRQPATGDSWAVKCFTRSVAGRQERYHEISRHLPRARLPFAVEFVYLEEGIRVHGRWYPVVKMQWVEGLLLNQFVRDNLARPALLESLLSLWARMARRLREAEVAHGDLQHGNVLLVPGSKTTSLALKLIDYDGMFVPALEGRPAGEVGHPAYQHPQRLREGTTGPEVDRVPLLVVAAALRCLVVGGQPLWQRYDSGDNLLFREADLRAPAQSAVFRELWGLPDPLAHVLVGRLALACHDPIDQAPLLSELLVDDLPRALSADEWARAVALLGSPREVVTSPTAPPADVSPGVDQFDFQGVASRPRRRRPAAAGGVLLAWASVGLLAVVLAVAIPIVWSMALPADTRPGAAAHASPVTTGGDTHRPQPATHPARPPHATRKATEGDGTAR
jgi:hypothetical protein